MLKKKLQRLEKFKGKALSDLIEIAQKVSFLVNTGASCSVLQQPVGPLTQTKMSSQRTTGKIKVYPWTQASIMDLSRGSLIHFLLVMPECPYP